MICSFIFIAIESAASTYDIDGRLAILLGGQGERGLEASLGLLQHEEGLVRALALAVLLGRDDDLERVGGTQRDRSGEGVLLGEPASWILAIGSSARRQLLVGTWLTSP